jgi:hypothetical protein
MAAKASCPQRQCDIVSVKRRRATLGGLHQNSHSQVVFIATLRWSSSPLAGGLHCHSQVVFIATRRWSSLPLAGGLHCHLVWLIVLKLRVSSLSSGLHVVGLPSYATYHPGTVVERVKHCASKSSIAPPSSRPKSCVLYRFNNQERKRFVRVIWVSG